MATTLKTWINKLVLKILDSLQVAYITRNNSDHFLVLHAIRKNYLLTFTKMYYHCVIEGISFQPTSMFSYLRAKTKSLFSDLPASGYWIDRVSWNVLSLDTSKAPQHISKHCFLSSSLKSLNVLLVVYTWRFETFLRQHRNIGIRLT